jgi:hypothetical protein
LAAVDFPESLDVIGSSAFADTALTHIALPTKPIQLGQSLFARCTRLRAVAIPEGVTHIPDAAFAHCTSLTEVTLPSTMQSIGSAAFYGCLALTVVSASEMVTAIEFVRPAEDFYFIPLVGYIRKNDSFAFRGCPDLLLISQAALNKLGYQDGYAWNEEEIGRFAE